MLQTGSTDTLSNRPAVNVPPIFNAATYFVDRNLDEGRAAKTAIFYEDQEITYGQVGEMVNRTGNALRDLGLQIEQRVLLLLLDSPQYPAAFFGAMKIGAVPIPAGVICRLLSPSDRLFISRTLRAQSLPTSAIIRR